MGTGLVLPALAAGALLLLPPPVDAVGAPEGTRPFHHSGDAAKYEKHFFATTTDKKVTNNLFHCSDGIMITEDGMTQRELREEEEEQVDVMAANAVAEADTDNLPNAEPDEEDEVDEEAIALAAALAALQLQQSVGT